MNPARLQHKVQAYFRPMTFREIEDVLQIADKYTGKDVECGHEGNHVRGHLSDSLDATDNDDGNEDGKNNTCDQRVYVEQGREST